MPILYFRRFLSPVHIYLSVLHPKKEKEKKKKMELRKRGDPIGESQSDVFLKVKSVP